MKLAIELIINMANDTQRDAIAARKAGDHIGAAFAQKTANALYKIAKLAKLIWP